jgi:hypothetical protein
MGSMYRIMAPIGDRSPERGESNMQQESFRIGTSELLSF